MYKFDNGLLAGIAATDHTRKIIAQMASTEKKAKRTKAQQAVIKYTIAKQVPHYLATPAGYYVEWLEQVQTTAEINSGLGMSIMRTPKYKRHETTPNATLATIPMEAHAEAWEWPYQPVNFGAKRLVLFGDLEFNPDKAAKRSEEMLKRCQEMEVVIRRNARRVAGDNPDLEEETIAAGNLLVCEGVAKFEYRTGSPIETFLATKLQEQRGWWRKESKRASEFGGNLELNRTVMDPDGNEIEWDEMLPVDGTNPEDLMIQAEEHDQDELSDAEIHGELAWLERMGLNDADLTMRSAIRRFTSDSYIIKHGGIHAYSGLTEEQLDMSVREYYSRLVLPGNGTESVAEDEQTIEWQKRVASQRTIPGATEYYVDPTGKTAVFTYWEGKGLVQLVMDTSPCPMPKSDESEYVMDDRGGAPAWMATVKQPYSDESFVDWTDLQLGRYRRSVLIGFGNPKGWSIGELKAVTEKGKVYLSSVTRFSEKKGVVTKNRWHRRAGTFVNDYNDMGEAVKADMITNSWGEPIRPVPTAEQMEWQDANEAGFSSVQEWLDAGLDQLSFCESDDTMMHELQRRLEATVLAKYKNGMSREYVLGFIAAATEGRSFQQCVEAGKVSNRRAWVAKMAATPVVLKPTTKKVGRLAELCLAVAKGKKLPSQASWAKADPSKVTVLVREVHSDLHVVQAAVVSSNNGPKPYMTTIVYKLAGKGQRVMVGAECNCEAGGECHHAAAVAKAL